MVGENLPTAGRHQPWAENNLWCHTLPAPPLGGFGKGRRASVENYNDTIIYTYSIFLDRAESKGVEFPPRVFNETPFKGCFRFGIRGTVISS
jgi:hypothetical protein